MSATKIGTAEFAGRVISGAIPDTAPESVRLHQLYPQPPVEIGFIDLIGETGARLTIHPAHQYAWAQADRIALTTFFTARFRDHNRLTTLLDIAAAIGEARHDRTPPTTGKR
jgi:hypothetical protein